MLLGSLLVPVPILIIFTIIDTIITTTDIMNTNTNRKMSTIEKRSPNPTGEVAQCD